MNIEYNMIGLKEIDDLFEEIRALLNDDSGFTLRVLEDMEKIICFLEEEVKGPWRGTSLGFENNICTLKRCVEALQNVELHKEGAVEYILGKYKHLKQTSIRNH